MNVDTINSLSRGDAQASFMAKVYTWMTAGLLVTAGVSLAMVSTGAAVALAANLPLFIGLIVLELVLVFAYMFLKDSIGFGGSLLLLGAYAALNGVTFSALFAIYGMALAAQAFGITAGMFGALSVFGFVTKRDLSGWGNFLFMGLVGILIALVFEFFIASTAFSFIVSCAAVLVFAGLTAYDTQKIKDMAHTNSNALDGALVLYLDFINLFLHILRILAIAQGNND